MKSYFRSQAGSFITLALIFIAFTYLHADNLTFPAASNQLELGRTYRLTWNATPGSGQKLYLMKGGYKLHDLGVVSTPSNRAGSLDWKALDEGTDLQIQLVDASEKTLFTGPVFTVTRDPSRSLRITEPATSAGSLANQEVRAGDTVEVLWDYTGDTGSLDVEPYRSEHTVQVELNCQGMSKSATVPLGNAGHGRATVTFPPPTIPSRSSSQPDRRVGKLTCGISVKWVWVNNASYDYQVSDYTGGVTFTIVDPQQLAQEQAEKEKQGYINVTAPIQGTIHVGDTLVIAWNHAAWMNSPVDIVLQGNGRQRKIAQSIPIGPNGKGTYTWTVNAPLPAGEGSYSFLVQPVNSASQSGASSYVELLCAQGSAQITSPTLEDSVFEYGTRRTISWNAGTGNKPLDMTLSRSRYGGTTFARTGGNSFLWRLQEQGYYQQGISPDMRDNPALARDIGEGGFFYLRIVDKETGCPALVTPIQIAPPGEVTITKPAAGDRISMAGTGPITLGTLSWNARLHYRNQKAKITLNRGSGSSATEVAVLSSAEPIITGTYDFRFPMPANLTPGDDYFIKMAITGPTAVPIDVRSARFSLTNEMPQPIRPGPQRPPFGR